MKAGTSTSTNIIFITHLTHTNHLTVSPTFHVKKSRTQRLKEKSEIVPAGALYKLESPSLIATIVMTSATSALFRGLYLYSSFMFI